MFGIVSSIVDGVCLSFDYWNYNTSELKPLINTKGKYTDKDSQLSGIDFPCLNYSYSEYGLCIVMSIVLFSIIQIEFGLYCAQVIFW